jgi:hypothetical protein
MCLKTTSYIQVVEKTFLQQDGMAIQGSLSLLKSTNEQF